MLNEFDRELKWVEKELLDLKTAKPYTSVRNTVSTVISNAYTGLYRITYAHSEEPIISQAYFASSGYSYLALPFYLRTPNTNTQTIEVNTTDENNVTSNINIQIISNRQITNIERI